MHELASQSLELVNRELSNTLETARGEIEDFVDGQSDSEALVRAASMLHLAAGALKIVEIHGAALLAEEMERTCRAIHESADKDRLDEGIEALTRAMVQLPAYLDRLMSGGSDVALVLLPLLNDLRGARNEPLLSEGTLLLLNKGPFEQMRMRKPSDAARVFGKQLPALAQKLRPRFQAALLGWIRGDDGVQHLGALIDVCNALEKAAESEPVRQLWAVTAGVLVALQNGALEPTVQLKRLLGQADRQLKRLIDAGEQSFVSAPPVDLLNSLLYYVARAPSDDERLVDLRRAFGVESVIPDAEEIEQAREDLAGPSVKLMRTVAEAIREDLGEVKDVLDIFVRTGMDNMAELKPQLDMLKKIGDTLGVLGLETARGKIRDESDQLAAIVEKGEIEDPAVLESIAASLLDVEDILERELVSAGGREAEAEAEADEDALESTQYRHVTQAVMRECIVNLAKIKEAVVKVLDEPNSARALDQVGPQLRGIVAGLLMLNKNRAVNVIERIGRNVTTKLSPGGQGLKPILVERLADAIVSIEYYMETLALGRSDPFYMLDNANRCLDLVEGGGRPAEARSAPASEAEPEREPEPKREAVPPAEVTAAASERPGLSVMEVDDERSEPELVEIFIEEAKEELAKIRENLPRWTEQPEDTEALIAVRRSFHTLKGSGRVVGAQLLGEFAWSIENLLNRVINQTLTATADMLEFVGEAVSALPALIEQLEVGIQPPQDVNAIIARADAFADGRPGGETAVEAAHDAAGGSDAGQAAAPAMDPVLKQIFIKEVREHLAAMRAFLDQAASAGTPIPVSEALHRACHTLYGSARMAACQAAIELAGPLDRAIRRGYEKQQGLSAGALATLGRFIARIERLTAALEADAAFATDAALVAELESLDLAQPAGAGDETAYMSQPDLAVGERASAADASADYDPEIAAIFCDEASELLDQAETQLQALKQATNSATALAELKRLLHTLKGGARLAGITAMGDLSHALETMLPSLARESSGAESEGMRLAQRALDQLQHLRDAVDAGLAAPSAAALVDELERFGSAGDETRVQPGIELEREPGGFPEPASAAGPGEARDDETQVQPAVGREPTIGRELPAAPAAGPEAPAAIPEGVETAETAESAQTAEKAETAQPAVSAEPESEEPETAEAEVEEAEVGWTEPAEPEAVAADSAAASASAPAPVPESEGPAPATLVARAETARVDAGLLDELLNEAGEISIFQSRLNQQVHSIEFHLGELGQTVTRLREQLRSLEAETEAQILHRHQGESGGDEHFDPLELDRYSTIQQLSRALAETSNDVASINELLHGLISEADTLLTQQSRVTTDLQDGLMQTRMVSFDRHATRLSRIVRQAAHDSGKQAELTINGAKSQLDRQILESIVPALEHLLRNAVVHGIEAPAGRKAASKSDTGRVTLNVRREGSEVLIDVDDDGAGLDLKAIRRKAQEKGLIRDGDAIADEDIVEMILLPGFSTADELTQAAGRGVGMDVVDNEIKRLGGSLRIETEAGRGTHFLIRLPYTLAITHALIVNVGDETFALPLPTVEGIARVRREQLLDMLTQDDPKLMHGESSYRVQHLGSLVGSAPSALPEDESAVSLVLVRAGENSTALLTDSLEGSREIIVKTLGPHIASVPGVSGATILGDGRVVVILDAGTLVRMQSGEERPTQPTPVAETRPLTALVVDDSITMRRVTQRLLERRGVRVFTARDGLDAIEVLREHDADIILLDIEMPRMDGYQFATHVRNDPKLKDTPIIMVTSRSGEKHRARAIELGVNDYLSKPYQEAEMVAAIEALVGRSL